MCEACDANERQAGINPALAARARQIESVMAGPMVPPDAWEVLLGQRAGAVPWPDLQRMFACLDEATRTPGSRLRCDAASDPYSG